MEPWLAEFIDNRRRSLTAGPGRLEATDVYAAELGLRRRGGRP
jgi:hypothetical protein